MRNINVVLFDEFETLDVFGPIEVFGKLSEEYYIEYYSLEGGVVISSQNVRVQTLPISMMGETEVLFIPGGKGTRSLIYDAFFLSKLADMAKNASYVFSVCTGAALLAKTGLLNGKKATSNKKAFDWVCSAGPEADWIREARWINDGTIYTSAGISAGIDMALGFIKDTHSEEVAEEIAEQMEYDWKKEAHSVLDKK